MSSTSRLIPDLAWRSAAGDVLHARLLPLLAALRTHGTLRAAAGEAGLSYRAAWGMILEAGRATGAPLAEMQRGRGARLTAFGAQLLKRDLQLRQALAQLEERLGTPPDPGAQSGLQPLRLVASHDPLLAEFCERHARPTGLVSDMAFQGSEASLATYARGGADLAGFHADDRGPGTLLRHLKARRDRLVHVADRTQGLIVARGNPKHLGTLADVARRRALFVNRQKGAGTRLLLDRLLAEAGLAESRIRGYEHEEYTHLAVAATIAAGRADAGLGVEAAAAQFRLDFVPLVHERYWLAVRESTLRSSAAQQFLRALRGKPLSRIAHRMPGYDISGSGEVYRIDEAFG